MHLSFHQVRRFGGVVHCHEWKVCEQCACVQCESVLSVYVCTAVSNIQSTSTMRQ